MCIRDRRYISYSDLRDDNPKVKLDPEQIKVIWIHDDNPIYDDNGFNWNSKNNIRNYYQTGGNLSLIHILMKSHVPALFNNTIFR